MWVSRFRHSSRRVGGACERAFSLVELTVVIGIVLLLAALMTPAFTSIKGAGDVTSAAYTIKGVLDQAHTYAKANNTYTWVGFYEENTTDTTATTVAPPYTGKGRVVLATIYSNDGTKIYGNSDTATTLPTSAYKQAGKIIKLEGLHMTDIGAPPSNPNPTPSPDSLDGRLGTPYIYQAPTDDHFNRVNSDSNDSTRFPFTAQGYIFRKTLMFAPSGEVYVTGRIIPSITGYVVVPVVEIGVEPTHGTSVDTNSPNRVAVQVTGIAGAVKVYRK